MYSLPYTKKKLINLLIYLIITKYWKFKNNFLLNFINVSVKILDSIIVTFFKENIFAVKLAIIDLKSNIE